MTDARIKFQSVQSTLTTLRKAADAATFARFADALSADARAAIERPPVAGNWVPVTWLDEALRHGLDIIYGGSLPRMRQHGRDAITIDMSGPYKLFIKALSPAYVVSRVPLIWDQYYQHNGKMTVLSFDEKQRRIEVAFTGIVIPSVAFWQNQLGTIEGTMLLTRLKNPVVSIVSGGTNEPDCAMVATYD